MGGVFGGDGLGRALGFGLDLDMPFMIVSGIG